jgi:hypothetical protein
VNGKWSIHHVVNLMWVVTTVHEFHYFKMTHNL